VRVHLVEAPRPRRLVDHQAGVLQHPKVLGDGWAAHRQVRGHVSHRPWPPGEQLENGSPGGVPQGVERSVSDHSSVSYYLPNPSVNRGRFTESPVGHLSTILDDR